MIHSPPIILPNQRQKVENIIVAEGLAQETLWLFPIDTASYQPIGRYGGWPCLPSDMDWPISPTKKVPLHFLFQVDLSQLPECRNPNRAHLPVSGLLLVFAGLTFDHIDGVCGECPGLVTVLHIDDGRLTDAPRKPPADLLSPFDAPDSCMMLIADETPLPKDGSLPCVPIGAMVMPELIEPNPDSELFENKALYGVYNAIRHSVTYREPAYVQSAHGQTDELTGPIAQFDVVRMLGGRQDYENAPDISQTITDPVHLFTMQLPPRCCVYSGDPLLDVLIEQSALEHRRFETIRINLDVT